MILVSIFKNIFSILGSLNQEKEGWIASTIFIVFLGLALILVLFQAVSPIAPFVYSLF